jgi:hypothetical protein
MEEINLMDSNNENYLISYRNFSQKPQPLKKVASKGVDTAASVIGAIAGVGSLITSIIPLAKGDPRNNQSTDIKLAGITVANHTTNEMIDGKLAIQGMTLFDKGGQPSKIPPGMQASYVVLNNFNVAESIKGVMTFKTFSPQIQQWITLCIFFENPYSGNMGHTRYNVQPDYFGNEASVGLWSWIDTNSRDASDNWDTYYTWPRQEDNNSYYWVEAKMTNNNPTILVVRIHGIGGNDRGDREPMPGTIWN